MCVCVCVFVCVCVCVYVCVCGGRGGWGEVGGLSLSVCMDDGYQMKVLNNSD